MNNMINVKANAGGNEPGGTASVPVDQSGGAGVIENRIPFAVRLWRMLLRRRWIILGAVIAASILGLLYSFSQTPLYSATSRLEISRESSRVTDIESVEREASQFDLEFYQTQYGLLESRALAERVVRAMRLQDNSQFRAAYGIEEIDESDVAPIVQRQQSIRNAVDILLGSVDVVPIRSSSLVDVIVTTPDPQLSTDIANAWGESFIRMNLDRRYEATGYARDFLETRLEQLRQRLEESERELVNYASAQNIINLEQNIDSQNGRTTTQRSLVADQLAALNEELARAEADTIRLQSQPRSGTVSAESLNNPTLASLRQRRAELSAEYDRLMTQFEPAYPPAQAVRSQLASIDQAISREESRISSSLGSAARAASTREAELRERVAELKGELNDLRGRSIQYNIFQREVDTNRILYDGLLQRYKEIGVAGGVGTNNIAIVDEAELPEGPSSPNHVLNFLASLVFGTALGVGLAFLMEQIDEGITEPGDIPRILNAPLLGVTPLEEGEDTIESLENLRSKLVEAYIAIQTNLDLSTSHGAPRSMSVTSTRPQEGKSTTAYALARTLARGGRRVILIDGDMRSPSVHHEFDVKNETGLSNALAGVSDLSKLLHNTNMDNFRFMTAGPQPPNAADLLVGDRMSKIINDLLKDADHVIVDSPPVLGLADAPLIAAAVEGTLYAVEAGAIRSSRVQAAMARLRAANTNLLGVVLTKFSAKHAQYNYNYAYDYSYEYGSKEA